MSLSWIKLFIPLSVHNLFTHSNILIALHTDVDKLFSDSEQDFKFYRNSVVSVPHYSVSSPLSLRRLINKFSMTRAE